MLFLSLSLCPSHGKEMMYFFFFDWEEAKYTLIHKWVQILFEHFHISLNVVHLQNLQ